VATPPSSRFYGYPADLIGSWCGVSAGVAAGWKEGTRKPSKQAVLLFELHRQRRVLGVGWEDWVVNGECLVDPEGNSTTQGQLRAYAHVVGWAIERNRLDRVESRSSDLLGRSGEKRLRGVSPLLGGNHKRGTS
jgi:hypothetical protein